MVAGVKVSFGLVKDEVAPALTKHGKNAKVSARAIGEIAGSYKVMERAAVRALKNAASDTQKLSRIQAGLNAKVKEGVITRKAADRALSTAADGMNRQVGFATQLKGALLSSLGTYLSINAAIQIGVRLSRAAFELEKEKQDFSSQLVRSARDFALIQEKGDIKAKTTDVLKLGRRFGFGRNEEEERQLFNIAQSVQSADPSKSEVDTRSDLIAILQASLVGISPDVAKELIIQGRAQGLADPTRFVRSSFIAGQLSGRTAEEVSTKVETLAFFEDKSLGFAIAAKLTDIFGNQAKAFIKNTGIALTSTLERGKLGVDEDASQEVVLKALFERDINNLRALEKFGVKEIRRVQGLQGVVTNLEEIIAEAKLVSEGATQEDLLTRRFDELKQEAPGFAIELASRQLEVARRQRRQSVQAQSRELLLKQLGERAETRKFSAINPFGFQILSGTDETGRVNLIGSMDLLLSELIPSLKFLNQVTRQQSEKLDIQATSLNKNTKATSDNTKSREQPPQAASTVPAPEGQ